VRSTSWIRFTVVLAARGVVATVFGMLFWAAAPMLIGWHSTTVMTGSMEPSLHVGDVVVSKPVDPRDLHRGQVLLFDDPDHAGVLRLHRFDALHGDGTLTTKGDANPHADSTPITRSAVEGVGYLRVPLVGTPITWAAAGDTASLTGLGAAVLAVTLLAVTPAVSGSHPSTAPAIRRARHRARRRRPRVSTAVAVTAVCVAGALALPAPAAAAAFTATTPSATSTLATATALPVSALTCATNSDGTVSIGWGYAGTAPERFTVLVDGQEVAQRPADARSTTVGSWDLFTWRTSTVSIRTDLTSTWTATSTESVRVVTVRFLGFGRTSCAP